MRASDTMTRTLSLIAAAAAITGLAGCGGGGGGGDNGGTATPATNALRNFMPGDSWNYSVTADIVQTAGSTIRLKDGNYTRSIGVYDGGVGISLTESMSLSYYGGFGENETNVSHIVNGGNGIFQKSDTRDIDGNEEYADPFNKFEGSFSGSQQILPVNFDDSTGFASDNSYGARGVFIKGTPAGPGDPPVPPAVPDEWTEVILNHEHFAMAVVGKEDVNTGAGKFSTFKCSVSAHYVTQGITIDGTAWWAPQLGSFVKENLTRQLPGVGTEHLSFTLKSYHLAPSAGVNVKGK
ncbi:MAG: hypothetical protein ABIY70_02170 [Capsulimonas sp.]|uniref:hypothetical protein n=1 Tax=Capsulimonas sp. TaxID=2494211 RepID=UPI00326432EC